MIKQAKSFYKYNNPIGLALKNNLVQGNTARQGKTI